MGGQSGTTPSNIPPSAFFRYPFRSPAVWLIPVLMAGAFVPLVNFVTSLMLVGYFGAVVASTAQGHTEPPPADFGRLLTGALLGLKWLVLTILWFVPLAILTLLLPFLVLLMFPVFGMLPAAFIVLSVSGSLRRAANPSEVWEQIRELGGRYLVLLLVLLGLIVVFYAMLFAFMAPLLDDIRQLPDAPGPGRRPPDPEAFFDQGLASRMFVGVILMNVVGAYAGVGISHFMGTLVLNARGPVDDPSGSGAGASPAATVPADGVGSASPGPERELDRVDGFIAEGKEVAALAALQELTREHPDDRALNEKQHRLALSVGDPDALAKAADRLIDEHLENGRNQQAATVLRETLEHSPDYRPQRPEAHLPLVQSLRTAGHPRAAVKLANGFHKRFPDSPAIPSVYATVARIFREDLQREDQFDGLCRFLTRFYPDDPEVTAVTAFWRPSEGGGSEW